MCDCYSHPCECCDELIPMHIADFLYERNEFKCWCNEHIDEAEAGAVIFEVIEGPPGWPVFPDSPTGHRCAIKGPSVGNGRGNSPNTCCYYRETVVGE